jgi:chromosome segregation ATPase
MKNDELDIKRIKGLIQDAEMAAAKAQGALESIQKKWEESYGDGALSTAESKLEELEKLIQKQEQKKEKLEKELESLYDWDSLED